VLINDGGNANGWLDVVLEGLQTGSGKVNKQGVGSLVEVKAGNLYVARTVGIPPTHFGLGARTKADVVRATWTNGVPQNVFDQRSKSVVKEVQQLKGSCPFVYARNGETGVWTFVSDALGRSPIGLLYDGVHLAGADTREWLFIDGATLKPDPQGRLQLDYTEELWEVAFLDEATLMAVDHPENTGVVPNERTIPGVLERKLFTVARPRALRAAFSDASGRSEDVTSRLARRDKVYVSPGPEMFYQGVRQEHSLVLDLGDVNAGDRIVLFLSGWIFYTDTSINVSISQRKDLRHFPPLLEVPDGTGGWKVVMESFGFPAGKTKTMPVDLTGLVDPRDPRDLLGRGFRHGERSGRRSRHDTACAFGRRALRAWVSAWVSRDARRPRNVRPRRRLECAALGGHPGSRNAPRRRHGLSREDGRPLGRVQGGRRDPHHVRCDETAAAADGLAPRLRPRLRRLGQGLRQEHGHGAILRALALPRDVGVPVSGERAPSRPDVPRGDAHAKSWAGAVPQGSRGKMILLTCEPGRLRRPTVGLV
jgi:hypothetical protein